MPEVQMSNMEGIQGSGFWDRLIHLSEYPDEGTYDFSMQDPLSMSISQQMSSYPSPPFQASPHCFMSELTEPVQPWSVEESMSPPTLPVKAPATPVQSTQKRRISSTSTGSSKASSKATSSSSRSASVSTTTSVFAPDTSKIKPPSNRATFSAAQPVKQQAHRTERRRAQNRQSQRAYRARKEHQLKDATVRMDQLEQELEDANESNKKLSDESEELRRRISEVEARNDELRKQIQESQKNQEAVWLRMQSIWMKKSQKVDLEELSGLLTPPKQDSV